MPVRELDLATLSRTIAELCVESATVLGDDVLAAYGRALDKEESDLGREILQLMVENAGIAKTEKIPACQDTGLAVVFLDIGQDVHFVNGDLSEAVNEGVRQGYAQGRLRASSLDPVTRVNTGDNTPAVLHCRIVPGDQIDITVMTKGFGGENYSRVSLFPPAVGMEGVKNFIVETVALAGSKSCPPVIVGVCLGGTFESSALTAKRSLLRPLGERSHDPTLAALEEELLERINGPGKLGIGPQGLGGSVTALDVHVDKVPTHIGSLPVAVNLQCHCHRHARTVI